MTSYEIWNYYEFLYTQFVCIKSIHFLFLGWCPYRVLTFTVHTWSLGYNNIPKRYSIILCFLHEKNLRKKVQFKEIV